MAPGTSKLSKRSSSSSGNLARWSGQCFAVNEITNYPRIWPCQPRVPNTPESQTTYLASRSLQQNDLGTENSKGLETSEDLSLGLSWQRSTSSASYRPISPLSVCYKLLERTILQKISQTVEDLLSTRDQVTALTTFIENGFEKGREGGAVTFPTVTIPTATIPTMSFSKNGDLYPFEKTLKTDEVFLGLTAAYDTIWHTGLVYKLSKCLPLWCVQTLELPLQNRCFRVHVGDGVSSCMVKTGERFNHRALS